MPVLSTARQSQSSRERTNEGYACVEHSKAEGMKRWAGRCRATPSHGSLIRPHEPPLPQLGREN
eukprot:353337-Chlamydomonas_euryale.AAC.3